MIGINTFGLSELLRTNFYGTLQKLYSCGFGVLEPCILFDEYSFAPVRAATHANLRHYRLDGGIWFSGNNAIKRLETARSLGFTVLSVQSSLALGPFLKHGIGEAVHFLKEQNIRYLVVSPMKKSTALAKKLIPYLQSAAEMLEKQGLSLVLHNYEHECLPEANGETLLDLYLKSVPSLKLELDVGWAHYAGSDALSVMQKYRDRLVLLHLKDVNKGAPRSHCFTAIGEGDLPLATVLKEAASLPRLEKNGILIDQDRSEGDLLSDLERGAKNVYSLLGI